MNPETPNDPVFDPRARFRMSPIDAGQFSECAVCHDSLAPEEIIEGHRSRRSLLTTQPQNGQFPEEQWWGFTEPSLTINSPFKHPHTSFRM